MSKKASPQRRGLFITTSTMNMGIEATRLRIRYVLGRRWLCNAKERNEIVPRMDQIMLLRIGNFQLVSPTPVPERSPLYGLGLLDSGTWLPAAWHTGIPRTGLDILCFWTCPQNACQTKRSENPGAGLGLLCSSACSPILSQMRQFENPQTVLDVLNSEP